MKVYFINPPISVPINKEGRCMVKKSLWSFIFPPITLAYCASVLRQIQVDTKVTDCVSENINESLLKELINHYNPDIIVINTSTPSIIDDIKIADIIKEANPNIKTILIGIHPSVLPDDVLSSSNNIDYIVRGEPEITLKNLISSFRDGRNIQDIKGISYQKGSKIINNPSSDFINDLDSLPFPAWDLIDIKKYSLPFSKEPFLMIIPSRGCPYQCLFCNAKVYYGSKIRLRSPQKVVDEIQWVINKFKIYNFHFWTESFTLNRQFAFEVCEEILKRNLKIKWTCNSRVDAVDPSLLIKMKQAGCWMIGFGIESGNQMILDNTKKGITLEQSKKAVLWARKAGLQVTIQCIIGLPGETKQTAEDTIEFAKKLGAHYAQFYCAVPFPGSDLYQVAQEKGWLVTNNWAKFEQSQSILNLDIINYKEVEKLRRKAYLNYYLSFRQMMLIIKSLDFRKINIKALIGDIKNFFQ